MKTGLKVLTAVAVAIFLFAGCSAGMRDKRQITVMGDAEVQVVPDEIVVTFGVRSEDKSLLAAKKENDAKVKAVLDTLQKNKIEAGDIQTDNVSIRPKYDYNKEEKLLGYTAETSIEVTLHDTAGYDKFLSDSITSGVNYVNNVEFKTSEQRKYREKARAMALKAAKEKAAAMAKELGQDIGVPLFIEEEFASPRIAGLMGYNSNVQYKSLSPGEGPESENIVKDQSTLALGRIKVTSRVTVTFELK